MAFHLACGGRSSDPGSTRTTMPPPHLLEQGSISGIWVAAPQVLMDGKGGAWVAWCRNDTEGKGTVTVARLGLDGAWSDPIPLGRGDLVELAPAPDGEAWIAWRGSPDLCCVRRLDATGKATGGRDFTDMPSRWKLHLRSNARGEAVLAAEWDARLRVSWSGAGTWSNPIAFQWPAASGMGDAPMVVSSLSEEGLFHVFHRLVPLDTPPDLSLSRHYHATLSAAAAGSVAEAPSHGFPLDMEATHDGCSVLWAGLENTQPGTTQWSKAPGWGAFHPLSPSRTSGARPLLMTHRPTGRMQVLALSQEGSLAMAAGSQGTFGALAPVLGTPERVGFPLTGAVNARGEMLVALASPPSGGILLGRVNAGTWTTFRQDHLDARQAIMGKASLDEQGRGVVLVQYVREDGAHRLWAHVVK